MAKIYNDITETIGNTPLVRLNRTAALHHAQAEVLLKLTEYRKPDPGPVEEIIFYTHPSTRTRIFNAMQWRQQMAQPR